MVDLKKGGKTLNSSPDSTDEAKLKRRDVLKKYGAYTAPLVVSMLLPEQAYGMNNGIVYSTTTRCQVNHTGMQATNMHCEPGHMSGHVM